jgi:hypothetical protein
MYIDWADPRVIIGLSVVGLIIIVGIVAYVINRRQTTAALRKRFGSEYDLAVRQHGSEHKAEAKLADRETRVEHLKIRDLAPTERERFLADWHTVQSRFVDHPKGAVTEAEELVSSLLEARGYPIATFDQRAADISVDHPLLMEYYRSAHAIAVRPLGPDATTEELRTAMIHYRTIFDELVQVAKPDEHKSAA